MRFWSGSALPANAGSDKIPSKGERDTLIRVETLAQRCSLAILICSHGNGHAWFVVLNTCRMGGIRHHTVFVPVHHPMLSCYTARSEHRCPYFDQMETSDEISSVVLRLVKQRKNFFFYIYSCHLVVLFFVCLAHRIYLLITLSRSLYSQCKMSVNCSWSLLLCEFWCELSQMLRRVSPRLLRLRVCSRAFNQKPAYQWEPRKQIFLFINMSPWLSLDAF